MALRDLFRPKWQHSEPDVRAMAVAELEDQATLSGIVKTDEDSSVRRVAIGRVNDQQVLAEAAKTDDDEAVQLEAIHRISSLGVLSGLFEEASSPVIRRAAKQRLEIRLSSLPDLGLVQKVNDPSETHIVQENALVVLTKRGSPEGLEQISKICGNRRSKLLNIAVELLGSIQDPRAIDILGKLALTDEGSISIAAIESLGKHQDKNAAAHLVRCLWHGDFEVNEAAIRACEKVGEPVTQIVLRELESRGPLLKQTAATVLDRLPWQPKKDGASAAYHLMKDEWDKCVAIGEAALEPLQRTLMSEDENSREKAAECLDRLAWKPGLDEVGAAYWIANDNWDMCRKVGAPAIEPLKKALDSSKAPARRSAAETLEALSWIPEEDREALRYLMAQEKWTECCEFGSQAATELIRISRLDDTVAFEAAKALSAINDPAAGPSLIVGVLSKVWATSRAASEALARTGDLRAVERAVDMLLKKLSQIKKRNPEPVIEALGILGDSRAVEPLLNLVRGGIRFAAVNALGRIGDARAVSTLKEIADFYDRAEADTPPGQRGNFGPVAQRALNAIRWATTATNHRNASERMEAVGHLENQTLLAKIARADEEALVRKAAVNRIQNLALLGEIARDDTDLDVCLELVEHIEDQALLTDKAENADHSDVRRAAEKRLENPRGET